MTSTSPDTETGRGIDRLRSAIESRDAATILTWYGDDAVLTVIDRDHPPSSPAFHRGRGAIREAVSPPRRAQARR
jgi:ketosteroid isomerase-like protein